MNNNKLIAEFMGKQYTGVRYKDYDTSWDWLIPVAKSITEKIVILDCPIILVNIIYNGLTSFDMKQVYKGTVTAIKWYLKHKGA